MAPVEKAVLAADILDGKVILQGLTAKSVAQLVGANASYMYAAAKLTPEQRLEVRAGKRPLLQPRRCTPAPIDWSEVDTGQFVEVIKLIGVEKAFDAVVEAERTSA
jgi:hypothetical protein